MEGILNEDIIKITALFISMTIGILMLIAILITYIKTQTIGKSGILITFAGLTLVSLSLLQGISMSFGGSELNLSLRSTLDDQERNREKYSQLAKEVSFQYDNVKKMIEQQSELIKDSTDYLTTIANNRSRSNFEIKKQAEKLDQRVKAVKESISPTYKKVRLKFKKIQILGTCEKMENNLGEFFYELRVNGKKLVERKINDKIERDVNGEILLDKIETFDVFPEEKSLQLSGFIREWDGISLFTQQMKFDTLEEISRKILLEKSGVQKFILGNRDNCKANLIIELNVEDNLPKRSS